MSYTAGGGPGGAGAGAGVNPNQQTYTQGYFDSYPQMLKERSTVGSASATGSVGGRTTWASGSDAFDPDKMSEDHDDDTSSSVDGMSDEGNASLVGFGEGANSTISGPISSAGAVGLGRLHSSSSSNMNNTSSNVLGRSSALGSPAVGGVAGGAGNRNSSGFNPSYSQQPQQAGFTNASGLQQYLSHSPAGSNTPEPFEDARMVDGMTYDSDIVDTTVRTPRLVGSYDREGSRQNSPSGR